MGFEFKQNLKLRQSLLMTPALQQAIKLLQLSRLELEQYVTQQLAENPVLEEGNIEVSDEIGIAESKEKESTEKQALEDRFSEAKDIVDKSEGSEMAYENYTQNFDLSKAKASINDSEPVNYENILTKSETLQEALSIQISEMDFSEHELMIASNIIGNIDDKGYLTSKIEDIAKQLEITAEEVDDVLDVIQRFEPNGVGATSVSECLLIQLRNLRLKNGIVEKIVEHHLNDLETRNFDLIAKKLDVNVDTVIDNVQIITDLDPNPGRLFDDNRSQYVVPDVYVFKMGLDWKILLNGDGIPSLRISSLYTKMAETSKTKNDDKLYLQDKLKSAQWLIKSLHQRQKTIYKVSECILKMQLDFFEKGVKHLKPLVLRDIADDIEMHESTISRVTNNKFIHTPQGIFELKFFFNSSVSTASGEDIASQSVKKMISEIVKAEDPKKPYSDKKIVDLLDEKGIQLARRTVSKYREKLGIAPSSKRKRYYK